MRLPAILARVTKTPADLALGFVAIHAACHELLHSFLKMERKLSVEVGPGSRARSR
jgi:hypothetical protein